MGFHKANICLTDSSDGLILAAFISQLFQVTFSLGTHCPGKIILYINLIKQEHKIVKLCNNSHAVNNQTIFDKNLVDIEMKKIEYYHLINPYLQNYNV